MLGMFLSGTIAEISKSGVVQLDAQTLWVNPSDWSEQNWDRLVMVQLTRSDMSGTQHHLHQISRWSSGNL